MNEIGIIGASGFIGRNLCDYFHKQQVDFVAIHRKKPEYDLPYAIEICPSLSNLPEFKKIIFLAEPSRLTDKNIKGRDYINKAKRTLSNIIDSSNAHFIYASSSAVYGDKHLIKHTTGSKLCPSSTYAEAKIECEKIILDKKGVVLRLSNIYGHGMSEDNVISKLIRQFRAEKTKIEIWDKSPIRDYLFVQDLIVFFEQLIKKESTSQVLNVGSGISYSVSDLFNILMRVFKKKELFLLETNPSNAISSLMLDIDETKKEVNWAPSFSITSGLNKLVYEDKI
tara:strand:- start:866 stop:1711 length:846 start_codon:yes stop_codon:yes gene_type:complete